MTEFRPTRDTGQELARLIEQVRLHEIDHKAAGVELIKIVEADYPSDPKPAPKFKLLASHDSSRLENSEVWESFISAVAAYPCWTFHDAVELAQKNEDLSYRRLKKLRLHSHLSSFEQLDAQGKNGLVYAFTKALRTTFSDRVDYQFKYQIPNPLFGNRDRTRLVRQPNGRYLLVLNTKDSTPEKQASLVIRLAMGLQLSFIANHVGKHFERRGDLTDEQRRQVDIFYRDSLRRTYRGLLGAVKNPRDPSAVFPDFLHRDDFEYMAIALQTFASSVVGLTEAVGYKDEIPVEVDSLDQVEKALSKEKGTSILSSLNLSPNDVPKQDILSSSESTDATDSCEQQNEDSEANSM